MMRTPLPVMLQPLLRGERHGARSVDSNPSSPHPLAPAPRCDPWAPRLSILLGDGLHLILRSDGVYPSRPDLFFEERALV